MLKTIAQRRVLAMAILAGVLGSTAAAAYDCNRNGIADHVDIANGSSPDCDGNGIPDGCDITPVNFGLASRGSLFVENAVTAIAPADLDSDGDIDLAAAVVANGGAVWVLWNSGTGSILAMTEHAASVASPTIQAGDINGDGRADLAVASSARITILLQRRLPGFSSVTIDLEPTTIRSLVLADLDGDDDLDISCVGLFDVLILKNAGGGAFTSAPQTIPIGSSPVAIAAAHLDGDNRLDLVTANRLAAPVPSGNISVLLNLGDGTFQTPRNFGVGAGPASVATGDLDGDGKIDVVTANLESGDFSILLGRGDGTFGEHRQIEAAGPPAFAALADVDADGDPDIVSARQVSSGGMVSLAFNHAGTLARPVEFPVRAPPSQLTLQDLTGDGRLDVAALEPNMSSILILEGTLMAYDTDCNRNGGPDGCELEANDCNGNAFPDECDLQSGGSSDCDRNGVPDECQADCNRNGTPDSCDIDLGTSPDCNRNHVPDECDVRSTGLSFDGSVIPFDGEVISTLGTADLDDDGHQDIFGVRSATGLSVLWNDGGAIRKPPEDVLSGMPIQGVGAGDLDGDGDLDLAAGDVSSSKVVVLIQDGNRSFSVRERIPVAKVPGGLVVGDLDADGDVDIAVFEQETRNLVGISNNGNGSLAPPETIGRGAVPFLLADVDADGRPDILAMDIQAGGPAVFWNAAGRFDESTPIGGLGLPPSQMAAADLDGDGDLDVAATIFEAIQVALQVGPRSFTQFPVKPVVPVLSGLAAADVDRDGDVDLATGVLKDTGGSIGIFLNRGDASSFDGPVFFGNEGFSVALTSGDYDRDGSPDLASSMVPPCIDFCEPFGHIAVLRNQTVSATSADANRNGRPDECDPGAFRRGDSDGDGSVSLADAVFTLRGLFQGGPPPGCAESADADNDGSIGVSDPVSVLEFLFRGGPPPAAPGPPPGPCGLDTDPPGSPADLGCAAYASC